MTLEQFARERKDGAEEEEGGGGGEEEATNELFIADVEQEAGLLQPALLILYGLAVSPKTRNLFLGN